MTSKRKTPKFNSVLEDFRKFAGLKVAEEQGKKEESIPFPSSDADAKKDVPAGGQPFGNTSDPMANKGKDVTEKLPDTKQPSQEEHSYKEVSPSSKVAKEDEELVNSLLDSIKDVVDSEKKAGEVEPPKEPKAEEPKVEEPKTAKEEPSKEASEKNTVTIDEDRLAEKIANHFRNVSVGYELGKFLFQSLGTQKQANDGLPPDIEAGAEAGGAGGEEDELAMILQAVQELVAEGQITEEQAQQFLMELQAAMEGGGGPEGGMPPEGMMPEGEPPIADEKAAAALESAVNAKVAELLSEGKSEEEIQEYIKTAAQNDAVKLVQQQNEEVFNDYLSNKVASAIDNGATDQEVDEYIKFAKANPQEIVQEMEFLANIDNAVSQKVAELKSEGKTEKEIEDYLKQAAKNDADQIKKAQEDKELQEVILSKVAEKRQEKVANMPPEVQQILEALQQLIESGQVTEEEAMAVLAEIGLVPGAEGGAPGGEEVPVDAGGVPPGAEAPAEAPPAAPKMAEEPKAKKPEEKEEKEDSKKEEE